MKEKARIAVLVSGGGTNLQALIDAQSETARAGKVTAPVLTSGKIELVISNNADAYALTRARKAGIETAVILKKECGGQDGFEQRIISLLNERHIDFIVLAGFMTILSKNFTQAFERRIINVHPSLIPSFCGARFYGLRVHEAALSYGVKVTGATVHFVNEIPDGGEIIMQKAVPVRDGDTPEILQKRVMRQAEWKILPLALEKVCSQFLINERRN